MGYYTREQLENMGFKSLGKNVSISDKTSIYRPGQMVIGNDVRIDDFCIFSAGDHGIFIGDHVHIACYVSVVGRGKITISDFAGIATRSSIYSSNDDYSGRYLTGPTIPPQFTNVMHADVFIGRHTIVGVNSTILPGVTIGEGTAIGAYSLVNKDIAAGVVAVGIPAKAIKERKTDIYELEKKLKEYEQLQVS